MLRLLTISLLLIVSLVPEVTFAKGTSVTLPALIGQIDQSGLHQSATWRKLLLYNDSAIGYQRSFVDDEEFFVSEKGKSNSRSEMIAMLQAMFDDVEDYRDPEDHPLCRFPARAGFLTTALSINKKTLPQPKCEQMNEFVGRMEFDRVYATFSSYSITTPSAWFGHLLLRLQKSNSVANQTDADLAVSFVPRISESFLPGQIFSALTGGSTGSISAVPFATRQKQIASFEERDLWSYQLNFSEKEIRKLIEILWELNRIKIDYYYFDDNSAALALALVAAAKPNFSIFRSLPHFWVTPVDIVKAMVSTDGMVKAVRFLPASLTRYLQRIKHLSNEEKNLIVKLADSSDKVAMVKLLSGLRPDRKAAVTDSLIELLKYYEEREGGFLNENYQSLRLATEKFRTTVKDAPRPIKYEPETGGPHLSAGTARVGILAGFTRKTKPYQLLRWRPVLRDEHDPEEGYPEGYNVSYLDTELFFRKETKKIYVNRFSLVNVASFPTVDASVRDPAWKFRIDSRQRYKCGTLADEMCAETSTLGAIGWSEVLVKKRYQAHAMLALRLGIIHDGYQKYTGEPGVIIGASNRFDRRSLATVTYHWRKVFTERNAETTWDTDLIYSWNFYGSQSLRAELSKTASEKPTAKIGYFVSY